MPENNEKVVFFYISFNHEFLLKIQLFVKNKLNNFLFFILNEIPPPKKKNKCKVIDKDHWNMFLNGAVDIISSDAL